MPTCRLRAWPSAPEASSKAASWFSRSEIPNQADADAIRPKIATPRLSQEYRLPHQRVEVPLLRQILFQQARIVSAFVAGRRRRMMSAWRVVSPSGSRALALYVSIIGPQTLGRMV